MRTHITQAANIWRMKQAAKPDKPSGCEHRVSGRCIRCENGERYDDELPDPDAKPAPRIVPLHPDGHDGWPCLHPASRIVAESKDCPDCGRIMSAREASEQGICNDCQR